MSEINFAPETVVAWLHDAVPLGQLSADSRRIATGDIFFAYPVDGSDGRHFIADAVQKGAAAIIYDKEDFNWDSRWCVPHLAIPELRKNAGIIANGFYHRPDAKMFVAAVTGTNGKTSCSQWLATALSNLGLITGVIGTLGSGVFRQGVCSQFAITGYTTPDAVQLHRQLADLRDAGVIALAIEASSIGLEQGRMNGMHIDAALFTNLSRDHLDYHQTMVAYEEAKNILFDWPGLRHAVVNLDDAMGVRLSQRMAARQPAATVIGYTLEHVDAPEFPALSASDIHHNAEGMAFRVDSSFGSAQIKTALLGQFNVSNVLGVLGLLQAQGTAWNESVKTLGALRPVAGRMQQMGGSEAPLVVIDYAHTPDALEKTLATLRPLALQRSGELWCVFGCGGDRDAGKRPLMGAASQAADHVILTSDNPRTENPALIIANIRVGMQAVGFNGSDASQLQVIEDRAAAILWTIKHANKNDVILLAGKGNEAYQEIGGKKHPFLEADHVALALAARVTMKGPR